MKEWLVFAHVLGAFVFILGHGATSFAMFQIRRETDAVRVRALIDVSDRGLLATWSGFVVMLAAGIWAGFTAERWGEGWLWTAVGVLIAMYLLMSVFGRTYFERVRAAAGAATFKGIRRVEPVEPSEAADLPAVLASGRPWLLTIIGLGGWGFILWLMMFKPF